ncbi:HAD family hydrolase [Nisaea nitritireducens]|uniref:HAD family hydrolase n=1 Tax=Nisaea nitritireducens TaxID=568392 RepID=UPI001865D93C|nr:HAD family phosphatase [Nisaea nitritireducens]
MFSAIIFDCDGVLINSESILRDYYRRFLAGLGLHYDPHAYSKRFKGKAWPQFQALLEEEYRETFGRPLPEGSYDGIKEGTWAEYQRSLSPTDGIDILLGSITRPKAVASNSHAASLERKLRHTGLIEHFAPHLISLEDVENGKPAPDMFLLAAERLGAAPETCLIIEDSVTGVTAGAAAGMTVWGYVGESDGDLDLPEMLREAGASDIFAHHDEIRAKLP